MIDFKEKHMALTRETETEDVMALLCAVAIVWIFVDTIFAWVSA